MVATTLVNRQIEEGEKLIKRLDQMDVRFDVVFWMLVPDTDNWQLVMGAHGVNRQGTRKKYELIQTVLNQTAINLFLDEITVVDATSDLCTRLRNAVQKIGEGLTPMPYFGNFIDGQRFPDSIIYRIH